MCNGYRITFDSVASWSFHNDTASNVIIFGVDNSSSSHGDNCNNKFLVLGEGPTFGINEIFGSPEKKFSVSFTKANTKFCLNLNFCLQFGKFAILFKLTRLIIVICLLKEKKSLNLKPKVKILTFQLNLVLEVHLIDLLLLSLEK